MGPPRQDRGFPLVQQRVDPRRPLEDPLTIGEEVAFVLQFLPFAGPGVDTADLPDLKAEDVDAPHPFLLPRLHPVQGPGRIPESAVEHARLPARFDVPPEIIEPRKVGSQVQERTLLLLPADVSQRAPHRFQEPEGGQAVVDVDPVTPRRRDFPADQDTLIPGCVKPGLPQQREGARPAPEVEFPLDHGAGAPAPDIVEGGAGAEEQSQCIHQDRFARPGLPRQQVEPGPELDLELPDQRKIADSEQSQHRTDLPKEAGVVRTPTASVSHGPLY